MRTSNILLAILFCIASLNADDMAKKTAPFSLEQTIHELDPLLVQLQILSSLDEKLSLLEESKEVQLFLNQSSIYSKLPPLSKEEKYIVFSLAVINQVEIIFQGIDKSIKTQNQIRELLDTLLQTEQFYAPIGGIIGYHNTFLKLLVEQENAPSISENVRYRHPVGIDLRNEDTSTHQAIRWGLESIPQLAEIYPVGGAGDRLNLIDENTQLPLPAAMLQFAGKSLLEGLIDDLTAREYLFFKLYHQKLETPIVLMTSEEKDNHTYVIKIFDDHHWYGRNKDSFFFIKQPLVPVITEEGNWSLCDNLKLTLKPGGHGVIWKLAEDKGAFTWLTSKGYKKALVRQINNPIAGIDSNLLALAGIGNHEKKIFGFASCDRLLGSPEGVNVVIEKKNKEDYTYCLTNIEYTDFKQHGIEDKPASVNSLYSRYPSNTNILFIDILAVKGAVKQCPIPGKLINMKNKVPYINTEGKRSTVYGGRLESTMQNIADCFIEHFPHRLEEKKLGSLLKTFLIYNDRLKTISTAKKSFHKSESIDGTPEKAYFDLLQNSRQLLAHCDYQLPEKQEINDYLKNGPNIIFVYHPALGPLYSIISQKLKGGVLQGNSEIQLNIAEIELENLHVHGSLIINADQPLGIMDEQGKLQFRSGSNCILKNVVVANRGINRAANNIFWKNQIDRHESLTIKLEEGAEFEAENIRFEGNLEFIVPAHHRMLVTKDNQGKLKIDVQPIKTPTWFWEYSFDPENRIVLKKVMGA